MKQNIITTNIAVSYTQCPRKAFLLLSGVKSGPPHEYVQILESKKHASQTQYLEKLAQEKPDVVAYQTNDLKSKHRFLTNASLMTGMFKAECGLLTRVASHSALGHYSYEPTIFIGTHKVSKEQKLTLFFTARVLEELQTKPPATGYIIDVSGKSHKVKLEESAQSLLHVLDPLQEWLAEDAPEEPPVILNKHCPICQFRAACRAKAEQENNLSLLDRVTRKIIRKYERKGIFTVTQLSYTFKPRKRKKHAKNPPPVTHKLELQALAIREKKIYLQELPEITQHPTKLFLDIEGIPDQNAYYLIGLLVCEDESSTHHSFWADTLADEARIWQQFVDKANEYSDAPLYHYGNYEAKAIKKLAKRYETDEEQLLKRLVNVNGYIYGKVYFPVYSNRLKEIGEFIGAAWSALDASGLQSLVWWHQWERIRNIESKDLLLTYNHEDCLALKLLVDELSKMTFSAEILSEVDLSIQPNWRATEVGEVVHSQFDEILKFAHSNYDKKKIRFRQNQEHKVQQKVRQRHKQRPRPTKVIQVPQSEFCPRCKTAPLLPEKRICKRLIVDLILTKNGIRKTVTEYVGIKTRCSRCESWHIPLGISKYKPAQLYGHGVKAWIVYHRIALCIPYERISEAIEEQFNEEVGATAIRVLTRSLRHYYAETEEIITRQLLKSPFIHVDETPISIRGVNQYVWVFTDGKYVVFKLTATREPTIVYDLLGEYNGILISDFYPGYDSVQYRQQKCWVHLIREINDDLWSAPFDAEFEKFVIEVRNLIIPIMEAVQKHGLKRRNLNKFQKPVDEFYKRTITDRSYRSELPVKYQNRFLRHRDSLFTFLKCDGIPWHNNTAETGIRHFVIQQKISGTFFELGARDYLLLLGIRQTCRFQNKSFFKFLFSGETDLDEFQKSKRSRKSIS
ncbi:IS66 family transposase [Chloroflexi bacterium TSY]|nr:IS66 family transposase [Chloroflexi bacterium TSY]